MEKSRSFWNPFRSFLGLSLFVGLPLFSPLAAKEIFNVPSCYPVNAFDYEGIKTATFILQGDKELGLFDMLKTIAQDKAKVTLTGQISIIGEAFSPNLMTSINIDRNPKEKAILITLNAYVRATATKKEPYSGYMPVFGRVFVLSNSTSTQEIQATLSPYLKDLVNNILSANKGKPEFFVVLPTK